MARTELGRTEVNDVKKPSVESYRDIKPENQISKKELNNAINSEFEKTRNGIDTSKVSDTKEKDGLTDSEKKQIKEEVGWSDKIIDHIKNMDQYNIYKKADLHEAEIDGRKCLIKKIDMDYVDPKTEKTNRELMEDGRPPIDPKTGEKIELHHMNQEYTAPFAELCENSEHGDGNHSVLHPKTENSWKNDEKQKNHYNGVERHNHWVERAKEV